MPSGDRTCQTYRNSATLDPMFRERVKAELESRGWSLLRLSRESGVTYSVIQDWLSDDGKSKLGPSTVILEKILAAVGFKMPPMRKPKPPRRK